ncbi:sulfite exporter TauE/SafE family protein [Pseudomonas sp. B14-6]|uniref:sulfite exporter TauE/SafE family protein n=1 Tax=Pseudomonas sp. B14-6 TaxID=2738843 RepID=UPI0021147AA8|nr:sulfite exporter TauE/SafE family protein [Pseudomonas sp. B14-6]
MKQHVTEIPIMLDAFLHAPFDNATLAIMFVTISLAYVIFSIAGFGTALVAGPVLVNYMPLSQAIPLLVLLDCVAAFGKLARSHQHVVRIELARLLPFMAIGSMAGIAVLLKTKSDVLMLAMGCFVTLYALYMLTKPVRTIYISAAWAMPLGVCGGLFGALFGSGGFLYAIYLNGRINTKEKASSTQSTLIGISTLVRISMLTVAGAYSDLALVVTAIYLLPALMFGLWAGDHISFKMSRNTFTRLINIIILVSGITLVYRAYLGGN